MIKVFFIVVTVFILCVAALFFLWRSAKTKQKEIQKKLESTNKQLGDAIIYQAKLESTIDILKKNRSEADEKINSLHNGDATSNALNELRKRKS